MNNKLCEIKSYIEEGYMPMVDYQKWRVAILNYINELEPEAITTMQKHDETDEVFVLLKGACILFFGEGEQENMIDKITCVKLEPQKIYNVKKGVYHTHTLSKEASVLIVENKNTSEVNSPTVELSDFIKEQLVLLSK